MKKGERKLPKGIFGKIIFSLGTINDSTG